MDKNNNYESMSTQDKWNMLATVANLYYNSELNQSEIANRFYTSRSKISRMLKEARELGIVEITINEPWERNIDFEIQLKQIYKLNDVRVITVKDEYSALESVCEAAVYYLDGIIRSNIIIGISWGKTLHKIVSSIANKNKKNIPVTVVPIMGGVSTGVIEHEAMDLAKQLAKAYGGTYRYIYAPLFLNNERLRNCLLKQPEVKETLEIAKKSDIIITSVGSVIYKTWQDIFTQAMFDRLYKNGMIGHMGGHFYNLDGKEFISGLKEKMIGITMQDMIDCKNLICVAQGVEKAEAVKGALNGNLINTLIIDDKCAYKILKN